MATTSIAQACEAHRELITKLNQLEAFLLMTFGPGREAFTQMAPASQDDYLAACTDTVQASRELAQAIGGALQESFIAEFGHG
ncbi:hypothetical protein RAMLITH_01705 [Ramlibacter sp. RBP-2]|uniref:Uncharacterized protein n=1 Tax=Ramlibacter lithotrophicus TaxID=2606681 RepID=A0A7X6DCD0_9BURK|nr:hypothetical protein [Ramlibacter lithotrophicus]NKE64522.1 hypothetical protein [Ramlibacter lithotrophicus]